MTMKTKTLCSSSLCFIVLVLAPPILRAQDLSKYRTLSLGTSLASVLKHTDQKLADAKVVHARPALIQELTWWPQNSPGPSLRFDGVEQILLSFYNGELYKISVDYDRTSTEGLNAQDMVGSISAKYGPTTSITPKTDSPANERYGVRERSEASWEDAQYSINLVRSTFTDRFELVIYSKRVNADAELATAQALTLEEQERPKREAERQKKETEDLEVTRQKNQKSFRP
jgi:hypothetical protein